MKNRKLSLLAGASALVWAQSAQAEINTDVPFNNPAAWMTSTHSTVSGGKATFTGGVRMEMLMQMNPAIKKGHWYRIAGTRANYSGSGTLRIFAGYKMPSAPTGAWVTLASQADINDTFTTSLGLTTSGASTKAIGGPGDSSEEGGAERFQCSHAWFGPEDPVVYPGQSSPHLHEGTGNTATNRNTTYSTLRTTGMSTCGDSNDPLHGVNRSAYWWPAVLDGHGNLVKLSGSQVYYKGPSRGDLDYSGEDAFLVSIGLPAGSLHPALFCAEVSPTNQCVNVPHAMKYTKGYKSSNGTCGPTDTTSGCLDGTQMVFSCHTAATAGGVQVGGTYATLPLLIASGNCSLGGQVRMSIGGPNCWDGVNIDSPDHRSHVIVGRQPTTHFGNSGCPSSHPVNIPTFSVQNWYPIDQHFLDGDWRLASDEMATCYATDGAGCSQHFDYFWGWSPTAAATWYTRCLQQHNSCASGELGDGTRLKMGGGMNADGTEQAGNGGSIPRPDRYVPTRFFGMSKDYTGNGAFSVVIRASDDGVWGFMGLGSLNVDIDDVTVTPVSPGG